MLLVCGATGRMGGAVIRAYGGEVRAASRSGRSVEGAGEAAALDVDRPDTFAAALRGVDTLFLMRPPTATRREPFDGLMRAAGEAGVRFVVCASVFGAGQSRVLPHRHMEAAVQASGIAHCFLRPADFMQNLETVLRDDIVRRGALRLPAGAGRSAFVDVEDIGACAAAVLARPADHAGRAYDVTGPEALSFFDVAELLSDVLDRPITYTPVSVARFLWEARRADRPLMQSVVMAALYSVQRAGRAAAPTDAVERLLGRPATSLGSYLRRERAAFAPG